MSDISPGGWWQIRQPPPARQPCGRITPCPDDQPCPCHGRGHRGDERREMSDPQLHLLLNRINELTAEVERLTDLLESADDVVTAQDLRIKAVADVLDTSQTDIAAELEQAIRAALGGAR